MGRQGEALPRLTRRATRPGGLRRTERVGQTRDREGTATSRATRTRKKDTETDKTDETEASDDGVPHRFHASVELDPLRVSRDAAKVADEVLQHLAGLAGAETEVTLDISVKVPDGVPEKVVRTVPRTPRHSSSSLTASNGTDMRTVATGLSDGAKTPMASNGHVVPRRSTQRGRVLQPPWWTSHTRSLPRSHAHCMALPMTGGV